MKLQTTAISTRRSTGHTSIHRFRPCRHFEPPKPVSASLSGQKRKNVAALVLDAAGQESLGHGVSFRMRNIPGDPKSSPPSLLGLGTRAMVLASHLLNSLVRNSGSSP